MRGMFAALLVAVMILVVALLVATVGSLGVAAIGWVLQRLFALTQWQGTLVALGVTSGLGFLVYKMAAQPAIPAVWQDDWDEDDEEDDLEEPEDEPPIVPWRRNRPTPGELPLQPPPRGKAGRRK